MEPSESPRRSWTCSMTHLLPLLPVDSSDDEAVEVHVTVDGAGMISSLQAQAPGSSDGGQGDAPLEKALQAVSQLFQSQGSTGQQEPPRGRLLAFPCLLYRELLAFACILYFQELGLSWCAALGWLGMCCRLVCFLHVNCCTPVPSCLQSCPAACSTPECPWTCQ